MYNVSAEYLEKINSESREVDWYGSVTLTNGTVYNFTPDNLKQGQTSISRQLCTGNKLEIGSVCSAELKIGFMLDYDGTNYLLNNIPVNRYDFYDAEIVIYFRLYLDEGYEDLNLGTFVVSEPERDQTTLICTAYDYMQKFSKNCVSTIQNTPYNVLLSACSVCGVELGSTRAQITAMANGRNTCAMYDPNNTIKTWRDVIGFIASMLAGNAVIRSDNKLYIIPYNTPVVRNLSGNERTSLTLEDYKSNYNILTAVNARANVEEKVKVANDGLTYALGTNPLIQYVTTASRETTYINILNVLNMMDYTPFNGNFFCDPSLEIGDVVLFTENHAENTESIITKITIKVNGHMEMSCEGDNPYKQKAEEAVQSKENETSGSVGEGVTFYDFVNDTDISVNNGETQLISIPYSSNGKYRHEFAAEVKLTVTTAESLASNVYTENDALALVKYYINGQELSYKPEYVFKDGTYLLHLFYIWNSDIRVDTSTFRVTLTLTGGSATVLTSNEYARIMQSGTAYVAPSNELEYIEVTKMPNKTTFRPQENLDYTGLVVSAFYEDGHSEDITAQCVLAPANGTQITELKDVIVDVTYTKDNVTHYTSFDLIVKYLLLLNVAKEPTKMDYFVGDNIDLSGIKMEAEFSDNTKKNVTNSCTYNPANGTTLTTDGAVTVTASYTEDGITQTAEIVLMVEKIICEEIKVTSLPAKLSYKVGETLDYTGVEVTAYYSDNSTKIVTEQCTFSPANGSTAESGSEMVEVTYTEDGQEFVDTFDIEIVEFEGIEITQEPNKTKYWIGDRMDYTGLIVSGVWSDGSKEVVTPDCTLNPSSGELADLEISSVEVTYIRDGEEYTESFDIECKEPEPILKYLEYYVLPADRIIMVTGLDIPAINEDQVTNLVIPETFTDDEGLTYTVYVRDFT